jgi:hypothetical protein
MTGSIQYHKQSPTDADLFNSHHVTVSAMAQLNHLPTCLTFCMILKICIYKLQFCLLTCMVVKSDPLHQVRNKMQVFENKVLGTIFGPMRE